MQATGEQSHPHLPALISQAGLVQAQAWRSLLPASVSLRCPSNIRSYLCNLHSSLALPDVTATLSGPSRTCHGPRLPSSFFQAHPPPCHCSLLIPLLWVPSRPLLLSGRPLVHLTAGVPGVPCSCRKTLQCPRPSRGLCYSDLPPAPSEDLHPCLVQVEVLSLPSSILSLFSAPHLVPYHGRLLAGSGR